LALAELASILKLHAVGFRRAALVEVIDDEVCLFLPALDTTKAVTGFLTAALADVQRHLPLSLRAAVGPLVDQPTEARRSRRGARLALDLNANSAAHPSTGEQDRQSVTRFDDVRARLLTAAAARAAAADPDATLPALLRLIDEQPAMALTLRAYLESGGHVALAAAELEVHVTTVRYRLRRAAELAELDLDDADDRLAAQLILRFAFGAAELGA
jgi:sugar diacid utilization regulator